MPLAVNIEEIKNNHLAYSCIHTHTPAHAQSS